MNYNEARVELLLAAIELDKWNLEGACNFPPHSPGVFAIKNFRWAVINFKKWARKEHGIKGRHLHIIVKDLEL